MNETFVLNPPFFCVKHVLDGAWQQPPWQSDVKFSDKF